jgi:two-component system sensor histidine kinase ChvG
MSARADEIGLLARAVSDMTATLRHRIDAVESFAADVAHEIKNPLASLRSATETLPRVGDAQLRAQLMDVAAHDVRRIDRLVSEISEASRIDAELSRATFEPVDLCDLFTNVVARKRERGETCGSAVEIACDTAQGRVMGVPLRLERIAENLIDNAVSFSPAGGRIQVVVSRQGDMVQVQVCDEGPGIPAVEREKVFRRFHSHRPEGEEYGNHSGLGLAIARTIAEAHGGSLIVADSEADMGGACLELELPAA